MRERARRNRGSWTQARREYIGRVINVLESMRPYWPLTLRQVYYQLVAAGSIENKRSEYQKLSRNLSQARLDKMVPWTALEDRARQTLVGESWPSASQYIKAEVSEFLSGYFRDLSQSQPIALEVWTEKDALSRILWGAAADYCAPVIVARGFSSVSYVHECAERIRRNAVRGRPTRILYFGDLDPSGWEMLPAMLTTLREEMALGDTVEGVRCALTQEQVEEYNLPHDPDALKLTDTRAKKYREIFGDLAVELDALPPDVLASLVRQSIEEHLDLDAYESERQQENRDREAIEAVKSGMNGVIEGHLELRSEVTRG